LRPMGFILQSELSLMPYRCAIEYKLSYLGITELLLLRGDRAKDENRFIPSPGGHAHAIELCRQVNDFNEGKLLGGVVTNPLETPFVYGVAGYPEKHDEAMNLDTDIEHLKAKVKAGAKQIVTQMFFDNSKYFAFVERLRREGIDVPVVPGLKPLTTLNHCTMLPKTFHIDFPQELAREFEKCRSNADVKELGVEWGIQQVRELKAAGVPAIHFYTMNAAFSTERIASATF
jgi:methylenetetrahydrofolate reductase (NADPH)